MGTVRYENSTSMCASAEIGQVHICGAPRGRSQCQCAVACWSPTQLIMETQLTGRASQPRTPFMISGRGVLGEARSERVFLQWVSSSLPHRNNFMSEPLCWSRVIHILVPERTFCNLRCWLYHLQTNRTLVYTMLSSFPCEERL